MTIKFFENLEKKLNEYQISKKEKQDIIDDYKQMYEDGERKGLNEEKIIEMIGRPEKITNELGFKKKEKFPSGEKIIALSPFISFIIFMTLGLTRNLWHPGWMVFLLIPVVAIIIEMGKNKEQYILTALSPFVAFTFFLLFGFLKGIWNPTWLIFIIIPMLGIIESKRDMDRLTFFTALSPFISFIAFVFISINTGAYNLAWLTFLLIVLLGIFHMDKAIDKILLLLSLIVSTGLYLAIGFYFDTWLVASSAFIIFIIIGLFTDFIKLQVTGLNNKTDRIIVLISIIMFLVAGYFSNVWDISCLLLLIIPVAMIIKYRENNKIFTPLSPFIALTIFILLGYFYNLWYIAWIAFIIIPIIAIIENVE